MRPFKVPEGPWVDLDTIQAIYEPELILISNHTPHIKVRWQHAFQDKLTEKVWYPKYDIGFEGEYVLPLEENNEDMKWPAELARIYDNMFMPFFAAWSGQQAPWREEYKRGH